MVSQDKYWVIFDLGFPNDSVVKNLPANAGDTGDVSLIPGWGRATGKGNESPLQYSCLGNASFHGERSLVGYRSEGHIESDMTEQARNI